jgi:hypothetical protein
MKRTFIYVLSLATTLLLLNACARSPNTEYSSPAITGDSTDIETPAYYILIEKVIASLEVDPIETRGEKPGQWALDYADAKVWIDCWYIESEKRIYIQVMSPLVPIPEDNPEAFYKDALEINDQLYGAAFSSYNGWLWLKNIREAEGYSESELFTNLSRISRYAEVYILYFKTHYNIPESSTKGKR